MHNTEAEIRRHLESGEQALWTGKPRQGVVLRSSDAFMIPFSLMWGGFAFFWEASALAAGAPWFFALWGIPFVLVGIYIIAGRFFVDARARARTAYGLTDRRVIIVSGLFSSSVNSLPLRSLHDVTLTEKPDRSGTVLFGRPHPFAAWSGAMPWPGTAQYQTPAFEMIPNAKQVHDKVMQAQRAAT